MSLPDNATSLKPSFSNRKRRSLSNGLGSLLKPKGSHINSFSIELDEPVKKYGPGETVQGKVILDVVRPLGVTHIVVSLSGGKRWVSEYYGDGFMSLFEEEIVLCGEGRLDPKYSPFHFQFNLDFPAHLALPSNIDFDKGTISYLITSTITRPAYTTPTVSCQAKVQFIEDIDIALLPAPKLRAVTLRPEQPGSSPGGNLKRLTSYETKRSRRGSNISTAIQSNTSVQSQQDSSSIRRASGSVLSNRSSSSRERRKSAVPSEPRSSHTTSSLNGESHHAGQNITVSAELCKSGCLPGHSVPLLVKIQHNKVVHNSAGILVTLYRQARVDMHPHLPLASTEQRAGSKYEDYYPRSRTGLGGLSLSAAGSSQVWRKDLSQTTAPLYIHPQSMYEERKISVNVPELPEAFPSIRNVPGHMISFRYMVEVIIDIHGKMTSQQTAGVGSGGIMSTQSTPVPEGSFFGNEAGDRAQPAPVEAVFLDTTRLRRDKNAVTVECELIIGTRDSQRAKGKQKRTDIYSDTSSTPIGPDELPLGATAPVQPLPAGYGDYYYDWDPEWEPRWDEERQRWLYVDQWGHIYDEDWNFIGYDQEYEPEGEDLQPPGFNDGPELIPPPEFSADLSEKDRLRQAEQSLYPSRPPGEEQGEENAITPQQQQQRQQQQPTAPALSENHSTYFPTAPTLQPPSTNHELERQVSSSSTIQGIGFDPTPSLPPQLDQASAGVTHSENAASIPDSSGPASDSINAQQQQVTPSAPSADDIDLTDEKQEKARQEEDQAVPGMSESASQSER